MNKVLITGAGGFIGSNLVEELVNKGMKVRAFIHYNSRNSWGNLELLSSKILNEVEIFTGNIEDPQKVFFEVNRVLKQNGVLVISWPFLYPVHEAPRDFFRYTEYGMKHLVTQAGFKIESLVPVSSFWITYFSFLSIYIYRKSKIIYLISIPILFIFKWLCVFFNKLDVKSNPRWTWNFYAILKKG